jgi:hypothetical protein
MGWAVANLALSAYEFKDTHMMFGQWEHALRNIGWGVDWLVKAHITASDTPTANVFVGQVCREVGKGCELHVNIGWAVDWLVKAHITASRVRSDTYSKRIGGTGASVLMVLLQLSAGAVKLCTSAKVL